MKSFDLTRYKDKLRKTELYSKMPDNFEWDEFIRKLGYSSCNYNDKSKMWLMDEHELTIFVLRFS